MKSKRYATLSACLLLSGQISLVACSAGETDGVAAAELDSALVLADVARCEAGRFEGTISHACVRADDPITLTAGAVGSAHPPQLGVGLAYGVRLSANGGGFTGEVKIDTLTAGEHIVYLGTPNIDIEILDSAGAVVSPTCGRYLPLAPPTPSYDPACTLRGAYALNLEGQTSYRLRFSSAGSSYARVFVALRREAGVIATSSPQCGQIEALLATLHSACDSAEPTTAISAGAFGADSPPISSGASYGVRLRAVAGANEGAVTFTPLHCGLRNLHGDRGRVDWRAQQRRARFERLRLSHHGLHFASHDRHHVPQAARGLRVQASERWACSPARARSNLATSVGAHDSRTHGARLRRGRARGQLGQMPHDRRRPEHLRLRARRLFGRGHVATDHR